MGSQIHEYYTGDPSAGHFWGTLLCNRCMAYDRIYYFLGNVLGGEVYRKRKQGTDPSYQCSGHYFAAAVLPEPGRKLLLVYRGSELYLCL